MKFEINYAFTIAQKGSRFTAKTGTCEIDTPCTEDYLRKTNDLRDFLTQDASQKLKKPVFNLTITSIKQI